MTLREKSPLNRTYMFTLLSSDSDLQLPTNKNAEAALLGVMLTKPERAPVLCGLLKLEDFFEPVHQQIFEEIRTRLDKGEAISPILLKQFDQSYLSSIAGLAITVIGVESLVREIRDMAVKRQAITLCRDAITKLAEGAASAEEIVCEMQRDMLSITETSDLKKVRNSKKVAEEITESLKESLPCFPTHLKSLDRAMGGGLFQGRTYCMAARPKGGKTSLLGTISHNLNHSGVKHLYLAFEMGAAQIHERNIARATGYNSISFLASREQHDFQHAVARYTVAKEPGNIHFWDTAGVTFSELRRMLPSLIMRHKVRGIIVDYIQLIGGKERNQTVADHLSAVAQWLADFSKKEKIWILYAAQLNRDEEIRSSDGVAMSCDQAYAIHLDKEGSTAWLEQLFTRYTPPTDVGSEAQPALELRKNGPYFEDMFS